MTTTLQQIIEQRIARENEAAAIAATIAPGDHYADGCNVVERCTREIVATCSDHSQAVRVMLAITRL